MADIFISYKRGADEEIAKKLQIALESQESESGKWTVWRDPKLRKGYDFTRQIYRELRAARCVVVLWSRAAVRARWVVMGEALEALGKGTLLPVLLDSEVVLPHIYQGIQHGSLAGWGGETSEQKFKDLREAIEYMLTTPPEPASFLIQLLVWVGRAWRAVRTVFAGLNTIMDFIATIIRGNEKLLWLRAALTFLVAFVLGVVIGVCAVDNNGKTAAPVGFWVWWFVWLGGIWLTYRVCRSRQK
jgi:hypothetical protein